MIDIKRTALAAVILAAGGLLYSAPAAAQGATRTWVSGTGTDLLPCTRLLPCKTFARALTLTADGGEINCENGGGYGPATITKSVSIICDTDEAGIVATSEGFTINGSGITVVLSGIDFEGLGNTGAPATNGVNFVSGAALQISNSKFRGFRNGYAILFAPTSNAQLVLDDVQVSDSGSASSLNTGAISIQPVAGVWVQAVLGNVRATRNYNAALRVDATGVAGAGVTLTIDNSRFSQNGMGLWFKAPTVSGSTIRAMVRNSELAFNANFGMIANGGGTQVRMGGTMVTGNGTGIFANGGGSAWSYGTNQLDGNAADGAFSGTIPAK